MVLILIIFDKLKDEQAETDQSQAALHIWTED